MSHEEKEYLKTAVNIYLVLLLFILPLYMKNGYVMLGDAKYQFFRNVTLFFVLVTTILQVTELLNTKKTEGFKGVWSKCACSGGAWVQTDMWVLFWGFSGVLSWCLAEDKSMAWHGVPGWYMGLLSELLFVWIYFAVSRWYEGSKSVLYMFWMGAFLVITLGILHRYVYDPLNLWEGLDDWNMGHLLSTIGNQNWYCGYISVASCVCFYHGYCGTGLKGAAGLLGCMLVFWTILTQGSEGGYLILLAQMLVLFLVSLENRGKMLRFLRVMICCTAAVFLGQYCIRFRGLMLVEDGTLKGIIFWEKWPWIFGVLAVLLVLLSIREKRGCKDMMADISAQKAGLWVISVLLLTGGILFIGCQISDEIWRLFGENELLRITDTWGNGRGILWRVGWGSYVKEGILRQLAGAGPDCFINVVYKWYPLNDLMQAHGQWENALYANAHNEWLNMLINQGILGLVSYAGIFITLFIRLCREQKREPFALLGMLAVSGYCVYGMVSFQQVLSTPLIFAVMGISEAFLRRPAVVQENKQETGLGIPC